jgi:hypothetical protein
MRTSYRDIFLLACCQALLLTNGAGLITMNGLVGYTLADTKALATLGVTMYVLGSAVTTMPASLLMARIGRRTRLHGGRDRQRRRMRAGGARDQPAQLRSVLRRYGSDRGLQRNRPSVPLRGLRRSRRRPTGRRRSRSCSPVESSEDSSVPNRCVAPPVSSKRRFSAGSWRSPATRCVALVVQSFVHVPPPTLAERSVKGRPTSVIVRQPVFIVAVLAGAVGYGLMNLLMTATPIAMDLCRHPFAAVAFVIEWHVVGMYAPGFFTGSLIRRFGVLNVILAGVDPRRAVRGRRAAGNDGRAFPRRARAARRGLELHVHGRHHALDGGHAPAEKARVQGMNDFIVFATMGVSSLASGAMVSAAGWDAMNRAVLPVLAVIAAAVMWFAWRRRTLRPAPTG